MCETELAWAAGFYDGEGSSFASPRTERLKSYARVSVGQKHAEPVVRFAKAVGVGKSTGPNKSGMYRWTASGTRADKVMQQLWPYLGTEKRKQYTRAVAISNERNQ